MVVVFFDEDKKINEAVWFSRGGLLEGRAHSSHFRDDCL